MTTPPRTPTPPHQHRWGIVLLACTGLSIAFAQGTALTLANALERLPQSPDWQLADLTYAASERSLESARAASGLSVNAGGGYSTTRPSNDLTNPNGTVTPAADRATGNANVSASASINVLPWSQAQVQARSAELALQRAALDRNDTRKNLAVNATNQYFTARIAATDFALAKSSEALSEARLKVATQQQANGQITREQLLTSQQTFENAKINTLAAKNTLEIARLTLFNTLGLAPNEATLSTPPTEYTLPKTALDTLIAESLEKRGDVQKATLRLREAEEALGAAQLNRWLPNSSINLGYGQLGGNSGPSVNGSLNFQTGVASLSTAFPLYQSPEPNSNPGLTFSVNLSIPILAPNQDAQIGSAQTGLESARKALENAKRAAELDVRQRYNDAFIATQRLGIAKLGLQSARANLETSQAKLAAGTATALDLQSAEQSSKQAERDLENAVAATHVSGLRLENALGK